MKGNININKIEIIEEYTKTKIGIEKLAIKYHIGKIKVKKILDEYNIKYKKRGAQPNNETFIVSNTNKKKYVNGNGFHYIVVDSNNDWKSSDIYNKGGKLTTYIKTKYNIDIPSLYERNKYYKLTGDYWWEQYLKYEKVPNTKTKKCPYCEWETVDIDNRCGMFETHLKKIHNINKTKYMEDYPIDKSYFYGASQILNLQLETNTNKFVTCKVCGKKLTKICNLHLKTHGMTKDEYIEKYGGDNLICNETYTKFNGLAHNMNISLSNNMKERFTSKAESEIINYIRSLGIECDKNRKILNGKELDIFIPSKNLAIEYNGNKWHTEKFGKKDKHYHISKLEECNKKGIDLIQIYDDEYINYKELCISRINNLLGISANKHNITINDCIIKKIDINNGHNFIISNSIEGEEEFADKYYGCFYKDNIIAVMSFKENDTILNEWQLISFAENSNLTFSNVDRSLFNYFITHNKVSTITAYADRRWNTYINNNTYKELGFIDIETIPPQYYFYCSSGNVRIKPYSQSEFGKYEDMKYDKIWNCGLIKYIYNNEKEND